MEFAFVTDELSQNPREAIEIALEWGITRFELRNIHNARFPRLAENILEELIILQDEYSILYTAVSPGFFKCRLDDKPAIDYALGEGLKLTFDFMKTCRVPLLICFSFEADSGPDSKAIAYLQELADRAAEHKFRIAIENETHCKCNYPKNIAAFINAIGKTNVGLNWDLANLKEEASDGYPAGYELLRPIIFNVHAKDIRPSQNGNWEWCPIGQGVCDWRGQMLALKRDRIVEHITIENHCGPAKEVGLHNLQTLSEYLQP